MISIFQALQDATKILDLAGITPPRRDAEELLACYLGCARSDLVLRWNQLLTQEDWLTFSEMVSKRRQRIPIAYIVKEVEFLGLTFEVSSDVLIPRVETEELVDKVLHFSPKGKWLDLCCGSGVIGLSLKHHCPHLNVTLADISPMALQITARNAERHQLQVTIIQSDFMEQLPNDFNGLVCNPPYLAAHELRLVEEEVRKEPVIALVGGPTGYEFYEKLAATVHIHQIWLEVGYTMGQRVLSLFQAQGYRGEVLLDSFGRDRYLSLQRS